MMNNDIGHPAQSAMLVLGIGCERATPPGDVIGLCERVIAMAGADHRQLVCIASIDTRIAEPAMIAAAAHFSVPLRVLTADRLELETPRLKNPSDRVFALTGCHGVAEAAALAAAGVGSRLAVAKTKSSRATAAIAFVQPLQGVVPVASHFESGISHSESPVLAVSVGGSLR